MRAAVITKWGEKEWNAMDNIIKHESNYNPQAVNPNGGATGICQALPADKMASEGADYLTNPDTQIRWCIRYIADRYGNPTNAWDFHQRMGWF